ncbi:hypothetical protein U9M48_031997 [Paspalum notatum var. saurae]|uniref:Uncharacterized protein n=1 Tax=Paspalum notatum var. saurae TaxID=547442 RepID=A0AAQ3U3S1_PASNO
MAPWGSPAWHPVLMLDLVLGTILAVFFVKWQLHPKVYSLVVWTDDIGVSTDGEEAESQRSPMGSGPPAAATSSTASADYTMTDDDYCAQIAIETSLPTYILVKIDDIFVKQE